MKRIASLVTFFCLVSQALTLHAAIVSFGTGTNQFSMTFMPIGNPGNSADTMGTPVASGRVDYVYSIGEFEVSEDMIDKYNASYGNANSLVISKDIRGFNKPATGVSWNEAARFVNWLNMSTNNAPAYKYTGTGVNENITLWDASNSLDYDSSNPYRSKRAVFALPSYNEWYKAAYYDSTLGYGLGGYWSYPTQSDQAPIAVSNGTSNGTAVYGFPGLGPADVNDAGGRSYYGLMGMGGNVWEWQESALDLINNDPGEQRMLRGMSWLYDSSSTFLMAKNFTSNDIPVFSSEHLGFRVVMLKSGSEVPEPSTFFIGSALALAGLARTRRTKKLALDLI